jgi:hypothetical protein
VNANTRGGGGYVRAQRSSSKPRAGIAEMKRIEIWFCDCISVILTRCRVGCNWCAINNKNHFGMGKQFHRLPNISDDAITDVGHDETSPAYRANRIWINVARKEQLAFRDCSFMASQPGVRIAPSGLRLAALKQFFGNICGRVGC